MLKYASLQAAMIKLHQPDQTILKGPGLTKLASHWKAYPTSCDDLRVCVLLPHGMGPRDASRLSEADAARLNVVVLRQDGRRWIRVWPAKSGD